VEISENSFLRLRCFIGNQTNFLGDGLREAFVEDLEKYSPSLGRNAIYEKSSKISKLPAILVVQFVRFYWRREKGVKSKINRKVSYPERLDLSEFCTDDLKQAILTYRDDVDRKINEMKEHKEAQMDVDGDSKEESVPNPLQNRQSGIYELFALITHEGRSPDSGHYIGWVRHSKDSWYKFDDHVVSEVSTEHVMMLYGGSGDSPMAYICFYRASPWRR